VDARERWLVQQLRENWRAENSGSHRQNGSSIASLRRLQAEFKSEWGGVEERRHCSKVRTRVVIMRCRAQGVGDEDGVDMR